MKLTILNTIPSVGNIIFKRDISESYIIKCTGCDKFVDESYITYEDEEDRFCDDCHNEAKKDPCFPYGY